MLDICILSFQSRNTVHFNMCNLTDSDSFNISAFERNFMNNGSGSNNTNTNISQFDFSLLMTYFFLLSKVYPYGKFVTCSLAIVTNILVVITIISSYKIWKYSTGLLLLTLGCIDICGCLMQITFTCFLKLFYHNGILVTFYICITLTHISNFMMLFISLNRYALVCTPFSHHRITSKKSVITQILTITIILMCSNLYLIFYDSNNNPEETFVICVVIIYVIFSHIVPVVASFILTVLVVCEFSRKSRNTEAPRQGERNITKAMIGVNVAFIVLTIPHIISLTLSEVNSPMSFLSFRYSFVQRYTNYLFQYVIAYIMLFLIRDINYSINLLIYSAYIPRFRAALLGLFTCKFGFNSDQNREFPTNEQLSRF